MADLLYPREKRGDFCHCEELSDFCHRGELSDFCHREKRGDFCHREKRGDFCHCEERSDAAISWLVNIKIKEAASTRFLAAEISITNEH
jgi:hypothetical protein